MLTERPMDAPLQKISATVSSPSHTRSQCSLVSSAA